MLPPEQTKWRTRIDRGGNSHLGFAVQSYIVRVGLAS
jgi:hypothetical protein